MEQEWVNLSSSKHWRSDKFIEALLKTLESDGVEDGEISVIRDILKNNDDLNGNTFIQAVRDALGPSGKAHKILKNRTDINRNIYDLSTPEKVRTSHWPNLPMYYGSYPNKYFDIHSDFFFTEPLGAITKDTPIGSAGSCFAIRLSHQLQHWKYNYIVEEENVSSAKTGYHGAPARVGTLFNVPSMRQMVERAYGLWEPEPIVFQRGSGEYLDPFRQGATHFNTYEEYIADAQSHTAALRKALDKCEYFIFTLGLTEGWQFSHSGDYTSISPHPSSDPFLLKKNNISLTENIADLERMFAVYKKFNPGIKFIISVSPVPLMKSFDEKNHIVVSNMHSKATLLSAAHEFCNNHPDETFYFPSFETVLWGTKTPWEADMRHVSSDAVNRVMQLFQKMFLQDQNPLPVLTWEDPSRKAITTSQRIKHIINKCLPDALNQRLRKFAGKLS